MKYEDKTYEDMKKLQVGKGFLVVGGEFGGLRFGVRGLGI